MMLHPRTGNRRGQVVIILTLAIPALIAAIAFGTDIALLYANWSRLQKTTDTAVMAGAVYLPSNPERALNTALDYARACGVKKDEIVAATIGSNGSTLSMTVTHRVGLITRFLGLSAGTVAANSTATVRVFPGRNVSTGRLRASVSSEKSNLSPA